MERSRESLGDFIQRLRKERRLSLNDVVARSGGMVSNAQVSKIENGIIQNPSLPKLKAIAKGLGVSADELLAVARGSLSETEQAEFEKSLYFMLFEKSKTASPEKKKFINKILQMIDRELDDGNITASK